MKRRGFTACCPKCGSVRVTIVNAKGRCNERDCGHYGDRKTFKDVEAQYRARPLDTNDAKWDAPPDGDHRRAVPVRYDD